MAKIGAQGIDASASEIGKLVGIALFVVVLVGGVGYFLWKRTLGGGFGLGKQGAFGSQQSLDNALVGAGAELRKNDSGTTFATFRSLTSNGVQKGKAVTYGFQEGDYARLNRAQKILLTLDKAVPGDWLTRATLG